MTSIERHAALCRLCMEMPDATDADVQAAYLELTGRPVNIFDVAEARVRRRRALSPKQRWPHASKAKNAVGGIRMVREPSFAEPRHARDFERGANA